MWIRTNPCNPWLELQKSDSHTPRSMFEDRSVASRPSTRDCGAAIASEAGVSSSRNIGNDPALRIDCPNAAVVGVHNCD